MKIVLDTNVIISAFVTRGVCADLYEYCLKEMTIFASTFLLDEVEMVLVKKLKFSNKQARQIKKLYLTHCKLVTPASLPAKVFKDKTDIPILGTAKAGKVDFLVTGDEDLVNLKKYSSFRILLPKDFIKLIIRNSKF